MPSTTTDPTMPDFPCQICGRPVDVSAAETDGYGRVVHSDCFGQRSGLLMQSGDIDPQS